MERFISHTPWGVAGAGWVGLKFTTSPTAGSLDTDTLPRAQCGRMRAARFRAHARGMAHAPPMATTVAIIYVPSVCLAPLVNYV